MLDLYRKNTQHLDLIAPDIYAQGFRDFGRLCTAYSSNGNPLFIAEHSSSPKGRAEVNVFYAVGDHWAIGFDPWAIDSPYPDMYGKPFVDPLGHEWGPQAYALRDSYVAIGRAMGPLVAAQGTDKLFTFVQEPGETRTAFGGESCVLQISYHDPDGSARGFVIERSPSEYILIGVGFSVCFRQQGRDAAYPVLRADWGWYEGEEFKLLHPMRREQFESLGLAVPFLEPGVARVLLTSPT
jgi:hypothetical protein